MTHRRYNIARVGFALLSVLVLAVTAAGSERPRTHDITVDDYLTLYLLTDAVTAPDGRHVAFTELRWGEPDEPRQTEIWVVNTESKQSTRLTFDPANDGSPQWAPDSARLYFQSKRNRGDKKPPYDHTSQVWVTGLEGGEPQPVTRVKGGIQAFELARNGRTLYYTKEGEESEREWKEMRKKYSDIQFDEGVVKWTELWKLDLVAWREEKVLAPQRVILEFRVAPDESRIALVTSPDDRLISKEGKSRVEVYDVATQQTTTLPEQLYRDQAPTPYGWTENLAWAPDGHALAFTVGFDGYPTMLLVAEWTGGPAAVRALTRPEGVEVMGTLRWIPGTADLCFLGQQRARQRVYCINAVRGGQQGAARVLTPGDVVAFPYSFSGDGRRLAVLRSTTTEVGDVYWYDPADPDAAPTRLTNHNAQVDTWKLPQISLVQWQSTDGTEVEGILELPPGYQPGDGPLPMVVELHGGPTDATLFNLRYWIYGRTIFAARGWALLSPNYRGSTGYGDRFMTDLIGHENDRDVQDILSGVDAMVARGIADPERLGVMGWSNGGFLTNCLITTTQRFKAASSGAGVLDQFMQWGLEDTPGHVINYMRGLPWERTEAYVAASPGYDVGRVTTPTLVHVGEKDERVPAAHSRSLFRALKEYTTTPTALLTYPGAGHGLARADHRKGKLDWDVAWFDKYVLGK